MGDERLAQKSGCSRNRSPRTATLYHSNGYAAELRIETDVTGVGYPCLKQLARAVHSKAEAGLGLAIVGKKESERNNPVDTVHLIPSTPVSERKRVKSAG